MVTELGAFWKIVLQTLGVTQALKARIILFLKL